MALKQVQPLLIGAARDLILNQLRDNMNLEIAKDDNMRNDGINVEPIDQDAFYISEKFLSLKPPAVYILKNGPGIFTYKGDPNWVQATWRFRIVVSAQDVGADVLEQKAESYGRVVYGLLDQLDLADKPDATARVKIKCVTDAMDFSDLMSIKLGDVGDMYRRDVIIDFNVQHFEARIALA